MTNLLITKVSVIILTLIFFASVGGCAGTPVPTERMAVAQMAVQRANTRSTSEYAPGELQIAIAKLASAKQALANDNLEQSSQLFEQAAIDAEVAELRADTVRAKITAQESKDASQMLLKELNRN